MYWEKKGPVCTADTVALVIKTAKERNIKHVVLATNSGETADLFKNSGLEIVCVTHVNGFTTPGENEMTKEKRKELQDCGMQVLTTTHLFSGVDRALSIKFGGTYPPEIMANTLRLFGQGVKVCVEIAVMAMDAGMIPFNEKIIAVGGSGKGADAAVIIKPANSREFFNTKVEEIICKPL